MPRARIKFKPPQEQFGGPFGLSSEYPNDEFRMLSAHPTEDGLLVLLEAKMADPTIVIRQFENAPKMMVPFYEVLHCDEHVVLLQFQLPFIPPPYQAIFESGNLPQFPYDIEDGWLVCELTTSQERLSQFKAELEETGFSFEIIWVTQSTDPSELLTDRQREFMSEAIERGYYESPRRCSLTKLADDLGVSKSTVSVVLHRAEETIIKEFFARSNE